METSAKETFGDISINDMLQVDIADASERKSRPECLKSQTTRFYSGRTPR
jgi:hypothetical protein